MSDSPLIHAERPADGEPLGLLILHHGRGSDEGDLLGLADALVPERRLHVVSPRAPLVLGGAPGHHWYVVPRVGFPDPDTFADSFRRLAAFHDGLWEQTGIAPERTILGGFSQGAVMSHALGLPADRPAPAGVLAFSGFVPTVPGWAADLDSRPQLPVFLAHGRRDPVIDVAFARRDREALRGAGAVVDDHESDGGHEIDAVTLAAARRWLAARFS